MNLGLRLGERNLDRRGEQALAGLGSIEAAVFALMGLILAFTLSGALQRFDERRQLILKEANSIARAYGRLDLIDEAAKGNLRSRFKDYTRARIDLYQNNIDFSAFKGAEVAPKIQLAAIRKLQSEVWSVAVEICRPKNTNFACSAVLNSLQDAFEAARLRDGANERHPPHVVYIMLFTLGLGSSFLAGVTMSAARKRIWVHMVSFAGALALAIFVITDIEFPRLGLVRVDSFDHYLIDLVDPM
jgi:hypothetical protein